MLRLADLLAGLSRSADLGFGLQPGEAVRSAALAVMLGRSLDLPDEDVRAAMYCALLLHLGCIGYAHETAERFGDELTWNAAAARTNVADPKDVFTTFVPAVTRGHPPLERLRLGATILIRGRRFGQQYESVACEVGRNVAERLHLPQEIVRAVNHSYERWNGGGVPDGLAAEDIPVGARLAVLASVATVFDTIGGPELAASAVRQQAGSILDPHMADHFGNRSDALLGEVHATDPRDLVLDSEPDPVVAVPESRLAEVAAVFGDVADVKTPFTYGRARGVAALARGAGQRLGMSRVELDELEVAALLHDVGCVAVPNTVWEKPGRLSDHEWEQARLHPYYSERILAGSARLTSLAPLVGMHHERLDGSGYHRGCGSGDIGMQARVLAAADAYQAMLQDRPQRAALTPEGAKRWLVDDARAGRLDVDAVNGVLEAAGHTAAARREVPAGLSEREVEVLALMAQGYSNPQIAKRLVISRRTAEHHVQHIYTKIGVSSRAAAALFAMQHGLLAGGDG
jgi:HD-GYP domain-containing protein (c-di-GMP phosphodiesterase class II)